MAVEKEHFDLLSHEGEVVPISASRGANGDWTIELEAKLRIFIGDGREIVVKKTLRTKATQQRGRRHAM